MFSYIRRHLKLAMKTVFLNYREYLSFFAAVFIFQTFFWLLTFSNYINNESALEVIESVYTEHIIVENMNAEQALSLHNDTVHYRILNEGIKSVTFSSGGRTAKVVFYEENKERDANRFVQKYINKLDDMGTEHTVTLTPLLTYESYCRSNNTAYWLLMILLAVVAVFLLMALYYIRVNNFRFTYGIYMTFGADFKRLLGNSIWEMLSTSLLTAVPSGLLSLWLTRGNYAKVGVEAVFSFGSVLRVLLFNCLVVSVAVWLPMKATSRKTPMSLIVARDNANYVSSPRVSSSVLGRNSFPALYELLSIVRFRKYYVKLLLVAVSFGALFICGLYVAQMNHTAEARDVMEYTVSYEGREDSSEINLAAEDIITSIADMDGVRYLDTTVKTSAVNARSHVLLDKSNRHFSGDYIVPCSNVSEYEYAFSALDYIAADALYLEMLERSGQVSIEGDLSLVLTEPKTVAVSENIYNERRVSFRVGDTIAIATPIRTSAIPELADISDASVILQKRVEKWTFSYETYTVGAVIKNAEAGAGIMICMNESDYNALIGTPAARNELFVYLENGTDMETANGLFISITNALNGYDGWSVDRMGAAFDGLLTARKNNHDMILTIAMAILSISPVIWFFSQILFWRKRRGEFRMLEAFGATASEIRMIHVFAGGIMAAASFVCSLGMGYAANYLLYRFCNSVLPSIGLGSGIKYEYQLSAGALAFSVLIAITCGFLSCLLPYYLGRADERKSRARENAAPMKRSGKRGSKGVI